MLEILEAFEWLELLEIPLEIGAEVLGGVFGGGGGPSKKKAPREMEGFPPAVERMDLLPHERGTGQCVECLPSRVFFEA